MQTQSKFHRRDFLKASVLGSAALASIALPNDLQAGVTKAEKDPNHGLHLGITTYTLRKFTLDQAIAMTKEAGVKYISIKDVHLPLKSATAERQAARKKIEDAGLVLTGGGVIYMKNDANLIRQVFDYAKESGMTTIVSSPDPDALDTVEKMVKEYDLRIAIHNHGPTDKHYPSPLDVLALVKDRDPRMGLCIDVGHTVRINQDPVPVIKTCASRLYDFHMKDVSAPTKEGGSIEVGKGVIDIVGVLKALIKVKYSGNVALEYEAEGDNPMPGVRASFAYMHGVLAAM